MRQVGAAAVCLVMVVLTGGCGEDGESASDTQTTTAPEVTAPRDTLTVTETAPAPATPPQRTTAAPAPPARDPNSGGATAPSTTPAPDSPENDRPPPPNSPAERFEKQCEADPDGCG